MYEESIQEEHFPGSVKDFYWPIYFENLDFTINKIEKHFDQPGYEAYSKLEILLVKAAKSEGYEEEFEVNCSLLQGRIQSRAVEVTAIIVLSCNLPISSPHNLASILQQLKQLSASQRQLMSEVVTLALCTYTGDVSNQRC